MSQVFHMALSEEQRGTYVLLLSSVLQSRDISSHGTLVYYHYSS